MEAPGEKWSSCPLVSIRVFEAETKGDGYSSLRADVLRNVAAEMTKRLELDLEFGVCSTVFVFGENGLRHPLDMES